MRNHFYACCAITITATLAFVLAPQQSVRAHCQVPCGIYDDHGRIHALLEDADTIAKAAAKINELSAASDPLSLNQATRWIQTKEQHASNVISVVSEYFLTQKVKDVAPGSDNYKDYLEKLATHHRVMRAAMKTKQQVDPAAAQGLRAAIEAMAKYYPGK